jgi:secondary thiamine-phosphate synthase enzyme
MPMLATTAASHTTIHVPTRHALEFVDITDRIRDAVADAGLDIGLVNVQSLHTTTAVVVNEHEPLLLTDFAETLERAAPADRPYRHDDPAERTVNVGPHERVNGHAHCRALLLTPSACLNVAAGSLQLGQWQRVFLVELDGPQMRAVSIVACGEPRR